MITPDAREARAKKLGCIATPVRCKTYSNVPLQGGFFSGAAATQVSASKGAVPALAGLEGKWPGLD